MTKLMFKTIGVQMHNRSPASRRPIAPTSMSTVTT
jgi:hypothetical protein